MQPVTRIEGLAVSLPRDNVDTDAIAPVRFGTTISRAGFEKAFFADWRKDPAFPLDRAAGACILVAGANYGCGSAREIAVWAHLQAGFRAVIAPSFAGIFKANAIRNGLLAVELPEAAVAGLHALLAPAAATVAIDLDAQAVRGPDGQTHAFEIAAADRYALLNGLDPIDRTLQHEYEIAAFQFMDRDLRGWAWPKKRI
jgi:3-isopropylmalate/(R)-2-methylmalate dehydratase small subunit